MYPPEAQTEWKETAHEAKKEPKPCLAEESGLSRCTEEHIALGAACPTCDPRTDPTVL